MCVSKGDRNKALLTPDSLPVIAQRNSTTNVPFEQPNASLCSLIEHGYKVT